MNCEQFEKLTDRWLSGELSSSKREEFEAHLSGCADCSASLAFQRRAKELMGGRTSPSSAMRFRLSSELEKVDAQPAWILTWTTLGKQTMKKAIWPATAAVMAIGTYAIVAPQGALATSMKNGLKTVKGSAMSSQPNSVHGPTLIDGPQLATGQKDGTLELRSGEYLWSDKDFSQDERSLIGEFNISIKVEKTNDKDAQIDMKVDYDKKKFIESNGEKPHQKVLTLQSNKDLRVVLDWNVDESQIESIRFEKLTQGKWTAFHDQSRQSFGEGVNFKWDMKGGEGIDMKFLKDGKLLDKDGEYLLKGHLLEPEQMERQGFPLIHLEGKDLTPMQREKLGKEMAELRKLLDVNGMHLKMSDKDRKGFELDMKKFADEMSKLKLDKKMTKKEREAFEKEMQRMKEELGNMKFEFKMSDKDRKGFEIDMKSLKDGLQGGAYEFRLGESGDHVSFSIKKMKGNDTWVIDYDKSKYIEKASDNPNEIIVENRAGDKRYIITKNDSGLPVSIETQSKVDGKWQSKTSLKLKTLEGFDRTGSESGVF